jgi:hypothetical protein
MVATLPWPCLEAAIEQVLQEPDAMMQEKQLHEWQKHKNAELMNVGIIVCQTLYIPITLGFNSCREL